ncbi:hypothetical protein MKX01_010613 [Papaver californicum]|nr:hypothetical protein MKX01_010613 [Papaver californicum]
MPDSEVISEVEMGLAKLLSDLMSEADENMVLQSLLNIEWMSNISTKMDLMRVFVLSVIEGGKFDCILLGVKLQLIEISGKVFECIHYGSMILPAANRVELLKNVAPVDLKVSEDMGWSIKGELVSLVSALPSNDQVKSLSDWMMKDKQLKFHDLSEAFEIWCYITNKPVNELISQYGLIRKKTEPARIRLGSFSNRPTYERVGIWF